MDNESDKYVLFSTICGILLTISELLPYIKSIRSNGILEFIFETSFLLLKKYKSNDDVDRRQGDERTEHLLENLIETLDEDHKDKNIKKRLTITFKSSSEDFDRSGGTFTDALDSTSENITIIFNSPKEIKIS